MKENEHTWGPPLVEEPVEIISNHEEVICIRQEEQSGGSWKARLMEADHSSRNRRDT